MFNEATAQNMTLEEQTRYIEHMPVTVLRELVVTLTELKDKVEKDIRELERQIDKNELEITRLEAILYQYENGDEAA